MKKVDLYSLILLAPLAVAATGCGARPGIKAPSTSWSASTLLGTTSPVTSSSSSGYTCPSTANVLPDYDYNHDGSGRYTACPNQTDATKVLLHGQTYSSNSICIFPAQIVDDTHIYTKPDLQTGGPWSKCYTVEDPGIFAAFDGISYNGLFIVESQDQNAMRNCLIGGNYFSCPHYSFGKFR